MVGEKDNALTQWRKDFYDIFTLGKEIKAVSDEIKEKILSDPFKALTPEEQLEILNGVEEPEVEGKGKEQEEDDVQSPPKRFSIVESIVRLYDPSIERDSLLTWLFWKKVVNLEGSAVEVLMLAHGNRTTSVYDPEAAEEQQKELATYQYETTLICDKLSASPVLGAALILTNAIDIDFIIEKIGIIVNERHKYSLLESLLNRLGIYNLVKLSEDEKKAGVTSKQKLREALESDQHREDLRELYLAMLFEFAEGKEKALFISEFALCRAMTFLQETTDWDDVNDLCPMSHITNPSTQNILLTLTRLENILKSAKKGSPLNLLKVYECIYNITPLFEAAPPPTAVMNREEVLKKLGEILKIAGYNEDNPALYITVCSAFCDIFSDACIPSSRDKTTPISKLANKPHLIPYYECVIEWIDSNVNTNKEVGAYEKWAKTTKEMKAACLEARKTIEASKKKPTSTHSGPFLLVSHAPRATGTNGPTTPHPAQTNGPANTLPPTGPTNGYSHTSLGKWLWKNGPNREHLLAVTPILQGFLLINAIYTADEMLCKSSGLGLFLSSVISLACYFDKGQRLLFIKHGYKYSIALSAATALNLALPLLTTNTEIVMGAAQAAHFITAFAVALPAAYPNTF